MKLHKSLVQAVITTLQQIFLQGVYADKAVEQVLKQNSRWGSRDRRFIAETTYEMVRWWRFILESAEMKAPKDIDGFYTLFAVWQILKESELPDWDEFRNVNKNMVLASAEKARSVRKYRESVPDWMDDLLSSELGEARWEKEVQALNKEASVVLRVNTLKTNRIQLQKLLVEQSVETTPLGDYYDALILNKRQNLQQLTEYKQGLFEVQDASSQLIAPFLELKDGMTVIDACAGAGGKSLHIAAVMHNSGKLISMDVEERKLIELKKRAERNGVKIIQTQVISESNLGKLRNTADRLLLDVPCSGLGVIRRNPDAKWKLSPAFIDEVKKTQQHIISTYSEMLKPGGIMVYATCSILPAENEKQVDLFLSDNKDFEFLEDKKIMPSEGFDGFYMAKLRRRA